MQEDAILVLFDLGGNFEEGEDDGRGLRLGQGGMLQGVRPQSMMEDIGRTSQEEPHSVGEETGRRRAVAAEIIFHRLDIIFASPTGAIEVFIEHLGSGGLQRGHHKARVITCPHDFGLEYDPPGLGPGPCGIGKLVIEATTGWQRLAMGLSQGNPSVIEPPRLLEGGCGLPEQDGIARKAKDKIRPAVGGDHVHDLRGGKMTITADQNMGMGPVASEIRQQPDQDHGIFGPSRASARTQVGRDQGL